MPVKLIMIKSLSLLFLLLQLISCKTQQYTYDSLPEKQLVFGKGGGMTGAVDSYTLLENGQLFHCNSMTKDKKNLNPIPKKKAKLFYKQLKSLSLNTSNFNQPGNMYFFIREVVLDTTYSVVWGSTNHQIDTTYTNFYKNLISQIK